MILRALLGGKPNEDERTCPFHRIYSKFGAQGVDVFKVCPSCRLGYPQPAIECPSDGSTLLRLGVGDPRCGTVARDQYLILELLGSGGMGSVYRAHQLPVDRPVALKILSRRDATDREWVARFENEAKIIANLRSDHITICHEFGRLETGELFIAMELIEGRTLHEVLEEEGPLPPTRVARIIGQICDALHEAHGKGLIHRDLKPKNVMIEREPLAEVRSAEGAQAPRGARDSMKLERTFRGEHVKLLDFGLAKRVHDTRVASEGISCAGYFYGTPQYMAPEQWEPATFGEVSPQTDIYALGVMIYELLTGEPPFVGPGPLHFHDQHVRGAPPAVALAEFESIVARCLAKEKHDRYASVIELREELELAVSPRAARARSVSRRAWNSSAAERAKTWSRGATARFLVFSTLAISAGALTAEWLTRSHPVDRVQTAPRLEGAVVRAVPSRSPGGR